MLTLIDRYVGATPLPGHVCLSLAQLSTGYVSERNRRSCSVRDCMLPPAYRQGLCLPCFQSAHPESAFLACPMVDCSSPAHALGLCLMQFNEQRRNTQYERTHPVSLLGCDNQRRSINYKINRMSMIMTTILLRFRRLMHRQMIKIITIIKILPWGITTSVTHL